MRFPLPSTPTAPVSSQDVRSLLRDSASILRIRFHEVASAAATIAAREEFRRFMVDALSILSSGAPVLFADEPPAGRRPRTAWLLNPLDGIDAFRGGFPCFAVVVGLRDRGRVVAGFVYNPVTEDLFWSDAWTDGAFHRDRRIAARRTGAADFGITSDSGGATRYSTALSLCSVASGRADYAIVGDCDWVTREVAGYIVKQAGGTVRLTRNGELQASARRRTGFWKGFQWTNGFV